MRILTTLSFCLIFCLSGAFSQSGANFWKSIEEDQISIEKNKEYLAPPTEVEHFKLELEELKKTLQKAPMEYTDDAKSRELLIDFPMLNGSIETFAVEESPVFAPELGAKYPSIRSFKGISTSNRLNSVRFDYSPLGLHASIQTVEGRIYIDPLANGNDEFHIAYPTDMIDRTKNDFPSSSCGWTGNDLEGDDAYEENKENAIRTLQGAKDPVFLRVYRLALACTGEYGSTHGGTKELVNASFNAALNRVNQIWQAEVSVKLEIIPENDNLIYLDPLNDPYNMANEGRELLGQNELAFAQSGIMFDWYDVGHVFTNGCIDVGGIAGGTVCSGGKMRGVTCHFSSNVEFIAVEIMAHEIGHQFSCGHSWNNCPSNEGQLSAENSFEPGSGTTIMSYAGACQNGNNVQNGSDDYYNVGSLEDFIFFSRIGPGNCAALVQTDNNEPEINLPYQNGFFIPIYTPFELTAEATDPDGDEITYCWEQYNTTGVGCQLGSPTGDCPSFRSYPPTTDPTRIFPRIQTLITNSPNVSEVLPAYSRDFNFACTVRDNNPEAGGTVWETVEFEAIETAGPFRVLYPNVLSHELEVGQYTEFTWDVANTEKAPVNCKYVDILLSTDGGWNFTEVILERTPNDGSEFIVVPDFVSQDARIKVKASDNIFFDMSATNFPISPPSAPNFTLQVSPREQGVCLPDVVNVEIQTGSLLGFDENIELSIFDGVPNDVSATLEDNNLNPSANTNLTVDFTDYTSEEEVNIIIQAVSEGVDTAYRTITFVPVSNDFSDLGLMLPLDGDSGLGGSPSFEWSASEAANTYTIEIASNPAFETEDIIDSASGLSAVSFSTSLILDPSTLYYWRVIPENECGVGETSETFAFHTETLNCNATESNDTPITISQSGTAEFVSKINILEDGAISDINIRGLKGNHDYFSDLELILKAPDGTEVVLVKNVCLGSSFNFDMDLDQDAPSGILCPPVGVFKPVGNLDALVGKSTQGVWELLINDLESGSGGKINAWSLEFCANVALSNPNLIVNEILPCNPGESNIIDTEYLEATDSENEDWELVYTLVSVPANGTLLLQEDTELKVGDTFVQSNVNWFDLRYLHDGGDAEMDNFRFTITDGDGGWTGTHQFNIEIDDSFVVSTDEVIANDLITVFPNPANDVLNVSIEKPFSSETQIELYDMKGSLLQTHRLAPGQTNIKLDINDLASALYFVRFESETSISTRKFTVNK